MNKIVIITRNLCAGGAERVVAQLVNYCAKKNIKCTLILLEKKERFYCIDERINIIEIEELSSNRYWNKIAKYIRVRKKVLSCSPDAVLAMPEDIGIYVLLSLIGENSIPIYVSERNNPWRMPQKRITRILRAITYKWARGIIFQSKYAASFFSDRIRNKSVVLFNPLDLNRIPPKWEGEREKRIVNVGRLEPQKNQKMLIKAFSMVLDKFPDYSLEIYGEGSLKNELQEYANTLLPQGSYYFMGQTQKLLDSIRAASIFVLTSDYEGMPNVLIEAMACGIPVISTDYEPGGVEEMITNGENGVIVRKNDPNYLAETIVSVLKDKEKMLKMANNALGIREKCDCEIVADKWIEYLLDYNNK